MIEDAELLRRYAEERSEPAFAELVQRHVNVVYAAALRRVGGDAPLAEEVVQTVFTALARKARRLAGHPVLLGWLHRSTRYAASDVLRDKLRRAAREQPLETMNTKTALHPGQGTEVDWDEIRPVIDSLLDRLDERERGALLLRFFEGQSFAQIGATLRLTEDAARMRVARALEKLRVALARRGVTSTSAALGVALAQQAGAAAPAGLAASVTGVALAGAASAGAGAGALILMGISKTKVGGAGLVLLLIIGVAVFELVEWPRREARWATADRQQRELEQKLAQTEERARAGAQRAEAAEADNAALLAATKSYLAARPSLAKSAGAAETHESVQSRYARALDLARRGEQAAALAEYLWCFDEGMARVSTFRVARRGALLEALARLGEQFPPAREALRERRDQAEKTLLAGGSGFEIDALLDFAALNGALGDGARTLAVYDRWPPGDRRREDLAVAGFDQLLAAQRYADLAAVKPFAKMLAQFERETNWPVPAGPMAEEVRRNRWESVLATAGKSIEVLAATGDLVHARELAARMLAFDDSGPTRVALQQHAERAGQPGLMATVGLKP